MAERVNWKLHDVVDVNGPAFARRNYLEQRDVRGILREALGDGKIAQACEVGCGYGRMTAVLTEFADRVTGFEREIEFVEIARQYNPEIRFECVPTLAALGGPDGAHDLAMTFTVLQHLIDPEAEKAIAEIKRVVGAGWILIVEETDETHRAGDIDDPRGMCTIGRAVRTYADLFSPFRLIHAQPRVIEPGYSRADVGTYMLFRSERSSDARDRD